MQFEVRVIKRKGRLNFEAEWTDPQTGKRCRKSLGSKIWRTAERAAGKLEHEILTDQYVATRQDKWPAFSRRYLTEATGGACRVFHSRHQGSAELARESSEAIHAPGHQ